MKLRAQGPARKAAEHAVDGLWNGIDNLTSLFTSDECRNYFTAAGCNAT